MKLLDLDINSLKEEIKNMGEKPFRAAQLYGWLMQGAAFDEMTNLSKNFREKLKENYTEGYANPIKILESSDGTKKFLFELEDKNTVESVFMKNNYGNTVCLSTQVGCRMGCAFCASCKNGLTRNLSAGEILSQFIGINKTMGSGRNISNIVLMGMGEPMDNYESVVSFIKLINQKEGMNVSCRNISLSTCGLVPKIKEFCDENLPVTLCISLHAPNDEKRKQILPVANKYKISEIVKAAKSYFEKTGRRIIIEYAVIKNFNDTKEDAKQLKELFFGFNCHINLIPLNNTEGCGLAAPTKKEVYAFANLLEKEGLSATVRRSLGSDISGACGQLKNRYTGN